MAWHKPNSLREWLGVLFQHRKKFFFPTLGVMIIVMLASFGIERDYRAEAKFDRTSETGMQTGSAASSMRELINPFRKMMLEDLRGRAPVEQLVDDLSLTRGLPHTADGALTAEGQLKKYEMVTRFQTRLSVRFQTQSDQIDLITVSFSDPDREMAPKVVNQLVENYLRETRRRLDEILLNAKVFFEREVDRYRTQVQELTRKKLQFQMDNQGLMPDDPQSVQNKLVEIRAALARVTQELEVVKAQKGKLDEFILGQPVEAVRKSTMQNPALTQLLDQRSRLQLDVSDQKTKLGRTDEHPAVKRAYQMIGEIDKKITETQAEIDGSEVREPNQSRLAAQQQVETMSGTVLALTRQRDELTEQVEKFELLSRNFFVIRNDFEKLERDLNDAGEQLRFWESNLSRTIIAYKADMGGRGVRLSFKQRAEIAKPNKPTILGVMAAAAILGLGAGGLLILLTELLDHSFRSVDQAVDDLKLPILGAVTEIVTPAISVRRKMLSWAVFPAIGAAMVLLLLVSGYLVYLSLEEPQRFEQLMTRPGSYLLEGFRHG